MMKLALISALAGSAAAFAPAAQTAARSTSLNAFSVDSIPGALPPVGLFDPLGFAEKADEMTLKRYREAELTHGRVSMLAVVGFLVGEAVESKTVLFNGEITGPAIGQLAQVNPLLWVALGAGIAKAESIRAEIGWVEPKDVPFDKPGQLRANYVPGDIGFDPLGLKPESEDEFIVMQNKELQNGRLAMLAAAGFLAQELVDGKGIIEHFSS
ncbi:hypothetical protein ACHAXM_009637 [Skeletonema potamos]|jgi:hypothetical protein